jgi:type II secretory ATPase GspE/PulE/Tfp pilus assembly ATPase PilB-like protein/ActR/RegA family two-component response regulator
MTVDGMSPYIRWLLSMAERSGLDVRLSPSVFDGKSAEESWVAIAKDCGLNEVGLAARIAEACRLEVADFQLFEHHALRLVPEKIARQHQVFPIRDDDTTVFVATSNPIDESARNILRFASGRNPVFVLAPPSALRILIDKHYSPDHFMEGLLDRVDTSGDYSLTVLESKAEKNVTAGEADSEPVKKLTSLILRESILQNASDIHLEPGSDGGVVRLRIDGMMHKHMQLPMPVMNRVVSRIKVLSKMDIANRLRPQDGRTQIMLKDKHYDLRISTVPTRDAEKVVIRILDPSTSITIDQIGLTLDSLQSLRYLLAQRDGIVIITGPTGSGKTTTFYAALRELSTGDVNIITVEDPIEYDLAGITQIQVEPKQGVTFASALRAVLRQDPDIIMVGEIRDLETAQIAVHASQTGHLVLATLHTNDALSVVTRLHDLGLDRTAIAESLRGALAQRLVRRVCKHCAVSIGDGPLNDEEERLYAQYGRRPVVRAIGCHQCGGTGYRGRFAILELWTRTPQLQQLIQSGAELSTIRAAATAAGMRSLTDSALDKITEGVTTLEELERVLGQEDTAAAAESGKKLRVLLVDDSSENRQLARLLLEKNGFDVSEASDGLMALEMLESTGPYVLMVLDINMPRMNGDKVLVQVKNTPATTTLPVIMLTGVEDAETEVRLIEAGADDYIRKPLNPARFIARIRAALRRAGYEGATSK